jgi:hypothetical protein
MGQGERHQRRTRVVLSDKGVGLRGRAWNGYARHQAFSYALTAHGSVFSHDSCMTQRERGHEQETWQEGAPHVGGSSEAVRCYGCGSTGVHGSAHTGTVG